MHTSIIYIHAHIHDVLDSLNPSLKRPWPDGRFYFDVSEEHQRVEGRFDKAHFAGSRGHRARDRKHFIAQKNVVETNEDGKWQCVGCTRLMGNLHIHA